MQNCNFRFLWQNLPRAVFHVYEIKAGRCLVKLQLWQAQGPQEFVTTEIAAFETSSSAF